MAQQSSAIEIDKSEYKVRITPHRRALPDYNEKCLYSVSIGAHELKIDQVVHAYKWAAKTFSSCALLLGDGLYRSTLQIIEGISEQDAIIKAEYKSKLTLDDFNMRIQELPPPNIIRTRDIIETSEFGSHLETIERLYFGNSRFADSVNEDALWFVNRQKRNLRLGLSVESAIKLSRFYVKQEVAVYSHLAEQGYLIDVYLGREIPTLAKLMTEEIIGGVPRPLVNRTNISLEKRVSRREKREKAALRNSMSSKELVAAFAFT